MDFDSFKEYAEHVIIDISENYNINHDDLVKFLYKKPEIDNEKIDHINDDAPVINYTPIYKKDKLYFIDEYDHLYDENFVYIEKEQKSRCRKNK